MIAVEIAYGVRADVEMFTQDVNVIERHESKPTMTTLTPWVLVEVHRVTQSVLVDIVI